MRLRTRSRTGLVLAALLAWGSAAFAAQPLAVWKTGSAPLQVESKSLETFGTEGRIVFSGDVVARQGELRLQADRVTVRVDKASRAVQAVEAEGNVRITKGEIVAAGQKATYDAAAATAVLTGEPKMWRDRDVIAGTKITLHLADDRADVVDPRVVLYQSPPSGPGRDAPAEGAKP